jgi:hypothetical protein
MLPSTTSSPATSLLLSDFHSSLSVLKLHWRSFNHRATKILIGVLTLAYLLGQVDSFTRASAAAAPLFALQPGSLFVHYSLWSLVTAGLYESSLFGLLFELSLLILFSPVIERSLGFSDHLKRIFLIILLTYLSVYFFSIVFYSVTEVESYLYSSYSGFLPVNAYFLVCLCQLYGEQTLLPSLEALKFSYLPCIGFLIAVFLYIFSISSFDACLILLGLFFGWLYLRFYSPSDEQTTGSQGNLHGDLRPEFSFAHLLYPFPYDPLNVKLCLFTLSTLFFQVFVKFGCFKQSIKQQQNMGNSSANSNHSNPNANSNAYSASVLPIYSTPSLSSVSPHSFNSSGPAINSLFSHSQSASIDAAVERRRMLAMRAIDDKLAELARAGAMGAGNNAINHNIGNNQTNAEQASDSENEARRESQPLLRTI